GVNIIAHNTASRGDQGGELDHDSPPVSRPLNIAHNTLPQVFARMGPLPQHAPLQPAGRGQVVQKPAPAAPRRRRGGAFNGPLRVRIYPRGIGGSSTNTDGTRVGSARRNSPKPMPASPVIRPGDSTLRGTPQSHPSRSILSRIRAARRFAWGY